MRNRLPTVTSQIPRDLRGFLDRLRDMLSDNSAARLLSAEDLAAAGVISLDGAGNISPASDYFATPPPPTNVTANGAVQTILVTWGEPLYTGHAYAEVWSSSTNDLGTATLLGMAPGSLYLDSPGPSVTRYYWVRFVNNVNTAGAYNSVSGTAGVTSSDLSYTMDLLSDAYGGTSEAPFFQLNTSQVIGGVTIPAGTYMKQAFIYDGTITNAKIADLNADKINAGYLNAARIAAGSIDATILNVDAAKITSGFINTARIEDATITSAKIEDAAITTAKISDAVITNAKIANGAITTAKIGDAAITAAKIQSLSLVGESNFEVKTAASGARMELTNKFLKVFDDTGTLRVHIGDLSV